MLTKFVTVPKQTETQYKSTKCTRKLSETIGREIHVSQDRI